MGSRVKNHACDTDKKIRLLFINSWKYFEKNDNKRIQNLRTSLSIMYGTVYGVLIYRINRIVKSGSKSRIYLKSYILGIGSSLHLDLHTVLPFLVWIRIRGSMPLTNGSGSCYFRHWPSRCQQKTNFLTQFFLLITFGRYIYIIFKDKKSKRVTK